MLNNSAQSEVLEVQKETWKFACMQLKAGNLADSMCDEDHVTWLKAPEVPSVSEVRLRSDLYLPLYLHDCCLLSVLIHTRDIIWKGKITRRSNNNRHHGFSWSAHKTGQKSEYNKNQNPEMMHVLFPYRAGSELWLKRSLETPLEMHVRSWCVKDQCCSWLKRCCVFRFDVQIFKKHREWLKM